MEKIPPELQNNLGFLLLQTLKSAGDVTRPYPLQDEFRLHHLAIMQYVSYNPTTSQKSICEDLRLDPSDVARYVKQLSLTGLISKKQNDSDKRNSSLYVTEMGESWLALRNERGRKLDPLFAGILEPQEYKQLYYLLNKFIKNSTKE